MAHVRLDVRVVDAGTLVTTVVLAAAQTDVAPANNTASVTTIVAKPIVVLPAPRLARTGTTTVGPVRRATLTTVGFGLSLNRPASVRMTVLRAGASRALLLRAGTRVGSTAIVTNARALSARVDAGRFSVKAVLGSAAIVRGRRYIVTVVATTPDAATSTVTVRFTG